MTETGWPLIPREVLPAPVRRAKNPHGRPPSAPPGEAGRQLSIFGAETLEPSPADLAGLLAGPGRLGRMGGTARVVVPVDAAWRVHVLVAELTSRGLVVNWHRAEHVRDEGPPIVPERSWPPENRVKGETSVSRPSAAATFDPDADPAPDLPSDVDDVPSDDNSGAPAPAPAPEIGEPAGATPPEPSPERDGPLADESPELPESPPEPRFEVVTAYSSRLNPLARAWPEAAAQLFLSGPRLRLWVAAAGEPVPGGYALGLGPAKDSGEQWRAVDAALVRAGLAGRLSEGRRHYIIAGQRRLRRLAELVGERPAAAPPQLWPGGAGA